MDSTAILAYVSKMHINFLAHLNSIHPHINFTMEMKRDDSLPFLDTVTKRDGKVKGVEIHGKPTHIDI